jgi:hypothetical protein
MSPPERKWIAERVEEVRAARQRQGHELGRLQQGIVEAVAGWDPVYEPASQRELEAIKAAVHDKGRWAEREEWRISTSFDSSIARTTHEGHDVYQVVVECDGQTLACGCPTIEGAYAFMHLYQAMIIDQFYSIGPPWAATGIFMSTIR